jgi:N-acetylglucosaminyldiphosphoundecaprenol N-acetyl-beta-D-mannosaminyltransferase
MPARPHQREIVGTPISITDYDGVLDAFDAAIAEREQIFTCCAPVHTLISARGNPQLRVALNDAAIVTPDGVPVVWLARALGEDIHARIYGPDLMLMQCERAAASGQRVWLYGGFDEEALGQLREALVARFAGLQIAGSWSPPHRPLSDEESAQLVSRINDDNPDIVWVGLGSPKQEIWMDEFRSRLNAPVLCGVGAAFDFHAGRVTQAPAWMQKRGLEWLYRLIKEPRRLAPRYLNTNPRFIALGLTQLLRERRAKR